ATSRVLFFGGIEPQLAAALREVGVQAEASEARTWLAMAREVRRARPQLIHARAAPFKAALIGRAAGLPVVVEAREPDASVARAARLAARTLCGGAALRDALLPPGAPPPRTPIPRRLLDPPAVPRAPPRRVRRHP